VHYAQLKAEKSKRSRTLKESFDAKRLDFSTLSTKTSGMTFHQSSLGQKINHQHHDAKEKI